jgi:serine/threonine protein kinase
MVGNDGHIVIMDFGFAKKISQKTYTNCGTPDYLAPEVILGTGYNQGVDWWALGVVMFHLLLDTMPFGDEDPQQIFKNILEKEVKFGTNNLEP